MATVPAVPTYVLNEDLTSTRLNALAAAVAFGQSVPAAHLRQTVLQTLATITYTGITFTTEDLDDDVAGTGGHSTSSATSRYTARYAGWYSCSGGVAFASNATGVRITRWAVNGTAVPGSATLLTPVSGNLTVTSARTVLVYLAVGDYVELQGYQSSGGPVDTSVGSDYQSTASIVWKCT